MPYIASPNAKVRVTVFAVPVAIHSLTHGLSSCPVQSHADAEFSRSLLRGCHGIVGAKRRLRLRAVLRHRAVLRLRAVLRARLRAVLRLRISHKLRLMLIK